MRIVIKFAGALLEDDDTVRALAQQVAALAQEGHEILIVHGGGRLFTATLKRMAIEASSSLACASPTAKTRDVAVMVFAGLLNKKLTAAISAKGSRPSVSLPRTLGVSSPSPWCTTKSKAVLGFVGYLTGLNAPFIESLWHERLLPVAPCLGLGPDNELYNINADHMAAACAEYLGADQLIYLTDVAGVLDGERVLSVVTCEEIDAWSSGRVVSGGMVLKLEAAKRAIEGGVREVRIVGGTSPGALCWHRTRRKRPPRQSGVDPWNARPPCAFVRRTSGSFGGMMRTSLQKKSLSRSVRKPKHSAAQRSKPDARLLDAEKFLLPTYKRQPVVMTHGRGAYIYDAAGKKYLDFLGGIAVNALGTRMRAS